MNFTTVFLYTPCLLGKIFKKSTLARELFFLRAFPVLSRAFLRVFCVNLAGNLRGNAR